MSAHSGDNKRSDRDTPAVENRHCVNSQSHHRPRIELAESLYPVSLQERARDVNLTQNIIITTKHYRVTHPNIQPSVLCIKSTSSAHTLHHAYTTSASRVREQFTRTHARTHACTHARTHTQGDANRSHTREIPVRTLHARRPWTGQSLTIPPCIFAQKQSSVTGSRCAFVPRPQRKA
jgi:hypothetical protein